MPVIGYYGYSSLAERARLRLAHCNDIACTSANITYVSSVTTKTFKYTSIATGANGLPVISYYGRSSATTMGPIAN